VYCLLGVVDGYWEKVTKLGKAALQNTQPAKNEVNQL
jgi:hypothetical protein